jgi:hypothetical protein
MMTPRLRKFVLTVHIITSVGWIGAAAAFLPLAIIVLSSQDNPVVRSAYLAMDVIARFIIVPSSFGALLSGTVLSLFTPWGLFRHFWVLLKFLINVVAILVLLNYMDTLSQLVGAATKATLSSTDLLRLKAPTSVAHATGALLFLLVATVLSVYKPRGLTRYGWQKQQEQRHASKAIDTPTPVPGQVKVPMA